jgi:hypothetical protein
MLNKSPEFMEKLNTLTPKEKKYFQVMNAKYGVLFITSKPGVAKSAIGRAIADKMGYDYVDMRLSMNDESDFKFPFLTDREYEGEVIKVSGYAVPEWAYEANARPTIIHFEELNRAPQFVRNAALQILLEREIGKFKFNDNVLMMASGNLGDEDGTDVEELDSALNNRLVHISHSLGLDEWLTGFAEDNCHRMITSFIKAYPEKLYQNPTENTKAYASPRSWTMMSKFITENYGMDASPRDFLPMLKEVATGYVGNTAMKFIQYCEDMLNISIQDVINDYDRVKKDLAKYNRDKNSELLNSLKEIDVTELKEKQLDNIVKFLRNVGDDEKTGYLLWLVDNVQDVSNPKLKRLLLEFRDLLVTIQGINKPGKK